jgi:hypothetical protein
MNINDEIRAAYDGLATRAPSPERIRAGIARRAKAHRQRRMLLLGAGVVTVLGLPAGLVLVDDRDTPTTAEALLKLVRGRGYPMPFTPSWIPNGYRLTERQVTTGQPGPQRRTWQLSPAGLYPRIRLDLSHESLTPASSWSIVEINGTSGWLSHNGYSALCSWEPVAGVRMSVSFADQPDNTDRGGAYADVALRIARSTSAAKVAYLRPTMSFGWLPEQTPLRHMFETFDGPDLAAEAATAYTSSTRMVLWVGTNDRLKADVSLEKAEKTSLRGRPAWYLPPIAQEQGPDPGSFAIELEDGRWLVAGGNPAAGEITLTKADLVRIVETFHIGPT